MIRLVTALRLRDGGLAWKPMHGDRFVAPDRGMDELIFVINDMATIIEVLQGRARGDISRHTRVGA